MLTMGKLIDEFRRGWQGISQPSPLFSIGFAACCLASVDRRAVVPFPDPAGRILHAVFSGRVLCHRVRRLPARDRDRAGRRHARHRPSISARHTADFARLALLVDLSDRLRPHDMGRRALSIDRLAAAGDLKAADPGRGVSQARCRRAAAPAEEQIVDHSRRSAPGAARSAEDLGRHRSADAGAVRRPTI